MAVNGPSDSAACPVDKTHPHNGLEACHKIIAENRAQHKRSEQRRDGATPANLDLSTHDLYPQEAAAGKRHAAKDTGHIGKGGAPEVDATGHGADHPPGPPPIPLWESVSFQHEVLSQVADKILYPQYAAKLKQDMQDFERRAKARHLPDEEVYKTYESVEKLLNAETGAAGTQDRLWLAQQVLHQAAHPEHVRQGNNNTCEMASLEFVLCSKNPSVVADLVSQAALTGSYRTKDGKIIQADVTPTRESNYYDPTRGDRSFASQVFQTTAINVAFAEDGANYTYHAEHANVPDGKPELGGYVIDNNTGKRVNYKNSDDVYATEAYFGLTGKKDLIIIRSGKPDPNYPNILTANTPAQFNQILRTLQRKNQFPVIVDVDMQNQPFWTDAWNGNHDPKKRYRQFDGHAIAITGFEDGAHPTTSLHNNWLPEDDRSSMSARELFQATRPAAQNLKDLQQEFDQSLKAGKPDYLKAIDILRLKAGFRQISANDLRNELLKDLQGAVDEQSPAVASLPALQNEWKEIAGIVEAQGGADPALKDPAFWQRVQEFFHNLHPKD